MTAPRDGYGDGIKKGGINDPVAQSIRNEQNRDAAPTKEEAERMHRNHLRSQGCQDGTCDEDDPDRLQNVACVSYGCKHAQQPRAEPFVVLCDDHAFSTESRTMHKHAADLHDADIDTGAIVFYECGHARYLEYEYSDDDPLPYTPEKWLPQVNPTHQFRDCYSHIDYVLYDEDYHYNGDNR